MNGKLYLYSSKALCVFDLETNKWNYITTHGDHGEIQSFQSIYKSMERVPATEDIIADKKDHHSGLAAAMLDMKVHIEPEKFPIEYDLRLK